MAIKRETQFPRNFLWGASTSAHQVEGGNHNQWSVWELENAKTLAAQAPYQYEDFPVWDEIKAQATTPENYISGEATDHYHMYRDDFKLAATSLHLNALRFSIEWSRIEPKEGVWDAKEIQHYRSYIAAMREVGIEPVMTLFHFTLPVWFSDIGGFEKRANVKYFLRFVEKAMSELGKDIRYVITINEPGIYSSMSYGSGLWPPGRRSKMTTIRVLHNLLYAHKKASKLIHAKGRYQVAIATNMSNTYAGDDAVLTRVSTRIIGYIRNDYVLKRVYRHCDFIGLNYYFDDRVYGYRIHNDTHEVSDVGWSMQPDSIRHVLEHVAETTKLPVMITENGVADQRDDHRAWWLSETIKGMKKAMNNGVPLLGYLHWSLLDNFEWHEGKWPRFGLVNVEYTTKRRTVRPSAKRYAAYVRKMKEESR